MVSYKERLLAAIERAQVSDNDLAKHLDVSIQAVRKVTAGKSLAFSAENNAKAAKYLNIDPSWLATGEGEMRPEWAWPFALLTPDMLQNLSAAELDLVEKYALHLISLKTHGTVLQVTPNTEPPKEGGSTLEFRLKTRRNKRSGASDRTTKPSR